MTVNQVAFGTTTLLSIGSIAGIALTAALASTAATVASIVAAVALGILTTVLAAVTIASFTAWFHPDSKDAETYFSIMYTHIGRAIPALFGFIAQAVGSAAVQGLAQGVGQNIRRGIGGDDVTVGFYNR